MAIGGKTLTVYLAADVDKLRKGLREAEDGFTIFGKNINSMVGPAIATAAAGVGALAASMAIDGVKSAVSLGESMNKASVIFGSAVGTITQFAETANLALGQTEQQALDAASTFAQFGKAAGLSGDSLAKFSTQMVTLATDFASFNNTSPEEAINAIGAALRGEAEPLRKFGVLLDDATLRARAMEMGIYNGSGALTAQQKVLAAQAEILAQSSDAQGDFERTSGSLANQVKIATSAFEDFKTAIGKGIVKGLGDISDSTTGLNKTLVDAQGSAENTAYWFTLLGKGIVNLYNNYADKSGVNAFNNFANKLTEVEENATGAADAVWQFGVVSDKTTPWILGNTAAVAANAAAYFDVAAGKFAASTKVNWGNLPLGALGTVGSLAEKWKVLTEGQKEFTGVTTPTTKAIKDMDPALRRQIDLVKGLTTQLDDASEALKTAREDMNKWQESMAEKISSGLDLGAINTAAFDEQGKRTGLSLVSAFQAQVDQAEWFGNILKAIDSQGGSDLVQALADLGPEAGGRLGEAIISEGLVSEFESRLDQIKSTARTAADAMTPEFLVAGVKSAVNFLVGTQNALGAATSQLEEMGRAMGKTIGDAAAEEIRAALAAAGVAMGAGGATLAGTTGPLMSTEAAARVAAGGGSFASALSSTSIAQAIERAIFDSNQRLGRTGQAVLQ